MVNILPISSYAYSISNNLHTILFQLIHSLGERGFQHITPNYYILYIITKSTGYIIARSPFSKSSYSFTKSGSDSSSYWTSNSVFIIYISYCFQHIAIYPLLSIFFYPFMVNVLSNEFGFILSLYFFLVITLHSICCFPFLYHIVINKFFPFINLSVNT